MTTRQWSAVGTTTVTFGTHQAGDLLIAFAFRDGSTTAPTLPAGWQSINTAGANTCSHRMAYKIAASSGETSGTWTNATSLIVACYRPDTGKSLAIGGQATGGAASTTVNYPALTMTDTSGASWVVGAAGHRSVDTNVQNAPAGLTNVTSTLDATDEAAWHDSNGGVTSWSSTNVSVGGTSSGWRSAVAEIVEFTASALVSDATGEYLSRTANLPAATSFTACGVFKVSSNRGATTWQAIWSGNASGITAGDSGLIHLLWNEASGQMMIGSGDNSNFSQVTFTTRPAVGDWFFWYVKCSGSGSNQIEAGWMPFGDTSMAETQTCTLQTGLGTTFSAIRYDQSQAGEQLFATFASLRCWNTALSGAELLAEAASPDAVTTSGLLWDVPCVGSTVSAAAADQSGNGYNLTVNGSLALGTGPTYPSGISGSGSVTLDAATTSGSGDVDISVSGASTLAAATAAGSGGVEISASGASTLTDVAGSGSGTVSSPSATGSGSVTLDDTGTSALGTVTVSATGASTLVGVAATGDAAAEISASGSSTLGTSSASGSGDVDVAAFGSSTLGNSTGDGTGTVLSPGINGSGAVTLADLSGSGDGSVAVAATGTSTLASGTGAGTGAVEIAAAGAVTLASVSTAGDASVTVSATAATTLANASASGAGGVEVSASAASTLASASANGSGSVEISGSGADALAGITGAGFGGTSDSRFAYGDVTLDDTASGSAGSVGIAVTGSSTLSAGTSTGDGSTTVSATGSASLADASGFGVVTVEVDADGSVIVGGITATGIGLVLISGGLEGTLDDATGAGSGGAAVVLDPALAQEIIGRASRATITGISTGGIIMGQAVSGLIVGRGALGRLVGRRTKGDL